MLNDLPQNLVLVTAAVFLLGWILGSISARIGARFRARARDPRDDRIRSLEAGTRVAQVDADEAATQIATLERQVKQAAEEIVKRDHVITHQQERLNEMKHDLQDSVKKTRELRNELSDRAMQNVKSEAMLREVQTELSVAHASTDLLATGVLDYTESPPKEGEDEPKKSPESLKVSKKVSKIPR